MSYGHRVARTKKLFAALTRRGPHRVLRGDLAFAGLPGVVFTPESGMNLAGVAFGHHWLTGVERYSATLEHLASWGIVAAAPDTQRGLAPSVLDFAFDLGTALDIVAGVRLGPGEISVHPTKLGLVGHGFGGSAAVFAAAGMRGHPNVTNVTNATNVAGPAVPAPKAVAAIFPTVTTPPAEQPAATLRIPGVVFSAPGDSVTLNSNALGLSRVWDGAVLRTVSKAKAAGLSEGRRLTTIVGMPGPDRKTQKAVRGLLTGYLLYVLTGDKTYREFADPDAQLPRTDEVPSALAPATPEDKVVALLKR